MGDVMAFLRVFLLLLGMISLGACAATPPKEVARADVAGLSRAIMALGPGIDPQEAARAARIAYAHTAVLKDQYQITDPPLVHNSKVNMGLRPRGLCWHWAQDLQIRLAREKFRTLQLHRAIANARNPFRIEHSTLIISRKGDDMFAGIVLDPWRYGGTLYWGQTRSDTAYDWVPQQEVFDWKRAQRARRAAR